MCSCGAERRARTARRVHPSTGEGQKADPSALVDASALNFSAMGGMNMGGGARRERLPSRPGGGGARRRGQRRESGRDGEPPAEAGRPRKAKRAGGRTAADGGQPEARTADAEAAPPALPSGGPASPGDEGQVRQGNVPGGDGGGFPGGGPGGEFPGGQARAAVPHAPAAGGGRRGRPPAGRAPHRPPLPPPQTGKTGLNAAPKPQAHAKKAPGGQSARAPFRIRF